MSENQIKGLIVIFLFVAVIPFIIFYARLFIKYEIPVLASQYDDSLLVAVADNKADRGIYFVKTGTTANQLLELAGLENRARKDFFLENGMKLILDSDSTKAITTDKIDNSRRLALGMPIELNSATEDDLLLIPGLGSTTAQKIIKLRSEKGSFKNIEELMEISGIKEKKLARLMPYLYLQKKM